MNVNELSRAAWGLTDGSTSWQSQNSVTAAQHFLLIHIIYKGCKHCWNQPLSVSLSADDFVYLTQTCSDHVGVEFLSGPAADPQCVYMNSVSNPTMFCRSLEPVSPELQHKSIFSRLHWLLTNPQKHLTPYTSMWDGGRNTLTAMSRNHVWRVCELSSL